MFCRIYLASKVIDTNSLLISLSKLLKAELVNDFYIEKQGYSIEVSASDDYDDKKMKIFPDGFLYFPFSIEVEIDDGIDKINAAKEVGKMLQFLWENHSSAIASCSSW